MYLTKPVYLLLYLTLLIVALTSCSATKKMFGLTNNIDISIRTTKDVNLDAQGNPSPIVVRLYELSTAVEFRKADYAALFNDEQATLGKDLLRRDEYEIKPEQTRIIARKAKENTKYLGLLAAYHNTTNIKWRAVISLNSSGNADMKLLLEKSGITVPLD